MRLLRLAVMVGLGCGLAVADGGGSGGGTRNFDATYKADQAGGPWLCPEDGHGFTVSHGKFSIPWDIRVGQGNNEHAVTVAHVDGVLPAAGAVTAKSVAVSPVPSEVAKLAHDYHRSLAPLDGTAFAVTAHRGGDDLELAMTVDLGDGTCTTRFTEDRSATRPPDDTAVTTELDCTKKPYAVATWSKGHPYGAGAYTQWSPTADAPTVYRCSNGCAVDKSPADNDDTWTLVGRCAAAALPDRGAAKWDTTYKPPVNGEWIDDWRCPAMPDKLVVSQGKLSLPWSLKIYNGEAGHLVVGHIDAVIRDDGSAVVQPVVTIDALPRGPEYHTQGRRVPVTIDSLRAFRPVVTFFRETDMRTSARGVGRRVEITLEEAEHEPCKLELTALDFKEQQFREEDGWTSECNDDEVWDSNKSYDSGGVATVVVGGVRRPYTCQQSPRCDAGVRPDRSDEWHKENRCK